jgi:glycosyltransferase involved in cell wall biosynthesis
MIKIADIYSADVSAYVLGKNRVKAVDSTDGYNNYLICSPGESFSKLVAEGYKAFSTEMNHTGISAIKDRKAVSGLRALLIDLKPDIIHTHNSKGGAIGRIAAKKAGIRWIVHQVHGFHFTKQQGIKKKIFEIIEKRLSKITDLILFQNWTDYRAAEVADMNKNAKLLYLGNGISFNEISLVSENIGIESPASIGRLVIGCVARFDSVKNHGMLFEALSSVKTHVPFELHLFGDGPLIEKYKELVRESSIESRVVFHGFIDKLSMIETLKKCNLSVLVSKGEGKPRSLMESSYLGLPIIGTDVVGTNEVVKDGENGFLIKLDDSKALASKLELLYKDEVLWRHLSLNARRIATEEFDENRIVDRLLLIYKMLYENRIDELIEAVEGGKAWQNVSL